MSSPGDFTDFVALGLPTFRHHESDFEVQLRRVQRGAQLQTFDPDTLPIFVAESDGDWNCMTLWRRELGGPPSSRRGCSMWSNIFPAMVTRPPAATGIAEPGTTPRNGAGGQGAGSGGVPSLGATGVRPVRYETWVADNRFGEKEPGASPLASLLPRDHPGLLMAATEERAQEDLFVAGWHSLAAPFRAGDPNLSSLVSELTSENRYDPDRQARFNAFARVVRQPSMLVGNAAGNGIAWQMGPVRGGLAGYGLIADTFSMPAPAPEETGQDGDGGQSTPRSAGKVPGSINNPGGFSGGAGTAARRPAPAPAPISILGATGWAAGGPFTTGGPTDQHRLGTTADGETINSTHLPTSALFIGHGGDAPLHFQVTPYLRTRSAPFVVPAHLRHDAASVHPWVGGTRAGLWRFQAESFFHIIEPPPTSTPTPRPTGGGISSGEGGALWGPGGVIGGGGVDTGGGGRTGPMPTPEPGPYGPGGPSVPGVTLTPPPFRPRPKKPPLPRFGPPIPRGPGPHIPGQHFSSGVGTVPRNQPPPLGTLPRIPGPPTPPTSVPRPSGGITDWGSWWDYPELGGPMGPHINFGLGAGPIEGPAVSGGGLPGDPGYDPEFGFDGGLGAFWGQFVWGDDAIPAQGGPGLRPPGGNWPFPPGLRPHPDPTPIPRPGGGLGFPAEDDPFGPWPGNPGPGFGYPGESVGREDCRPMHPTYLSDWRRRVHLATPMELGLTSQAFRSVRVDSRAEDFRWTNRPCPRDLALDEARMPYVIRTEAVAKLPGGGPWAAHTYAPGLGPYPGGSAPGFLADFAPETGAHDYATDYAPAGVTLSTVYRMGVPPVRWGMGVPDPTTGAPKSGHSWHWTGAQTLFEGWASGTASEVARLRSDGFQAAKLYVDSGENIVVANGGGGILYQHAGGYHVRNTPNTTTTRKFLEQTGDGANSAAPTFVAIALADLPSATALSVLGRAANSAGVRADIQAAENDMWLSCLSDTLAFRTLRFPKGHIDGLRVRYSSATAVIVETGQARSSDDTKNLTLAAESTVSITTIGTALGLDRVTASATATTSASTSITMSASLYSETCLSNTVRSLTGTVSTVGTAATGTSTKFLSEVAIGDVIRSATKGASRVTAITSDTALTLVAALPGGDCTDEACTLYENLIIWPDTGTANDQRRVNTVTHNGITVILSAATVSNAAGRTVAIGAEPGGGTAGSQFAAWFFVWLIEKDDAADSTVILSSQRTEPYGVASYAGGNPRRRLLAVRNDSSANIVEFESMGQGRRRIVRTLRYTDIASTSSTSFVTVDVSDYVPPTADLGYFSMRVDASAGAAAEHIGGILWSTQNWSSRYITDGTATDRATGGDNTLPVIAQAVKHKVDNNGTGLLTTFGWEEEV